MSHEQLSLFALVFLSCGLLSALATGWARVYALRNGVLDYPNVRSSHSQPTPRTGGLGIVASCLIALVLAALCGRISYAVAIPLGLGGSLVATIGMLDDRASLSPLIRCCSHALAAAVVVLGIGSIAVVDFGFFELNIGILGCFLAAVGVVWLINLTNFMDGIDGIAASEVLFATGVAGLLALLSGEQPVALICFAVAGACLGFLYHNWPPARIFMGDAGSGFLGFIFGALLLLDTAKYPVHLWFWLILFSVFIVDATITLLRRLCRGERVYLSHRSHAYQHASQRWGHLRTTCGVIAIDIFWLAPLAVWAWFVPHFGAALLGVAAFPLTLIALHLRAGNPGPTPRPAIAGPEREVVTA
jgi:Fuc2NAc and GlcNAc transferase